MELIELDLQGNFGLKRVNFRKFERVRKINHQRFEIELPFYHILCILGPPKTLSKLSLIELDLQGHFGLKRVNFRKFWIVCVIIRQGFELKKPIENGVNWR